MSLNVPGGGVQKKLTAEGQHQTEQSAHALSLAWRRPDEIPEVELRNMKEYVVAVFRAHSGKTYTFAATYLNGYRLNYEWGCPKNDSDLTCDGCEDGCPTTGWFVKTGEEDDGTTFHTLGLKDGDEIKGWRELPTWEDAETDAAAPGDTGLLVGVPSEPLSTKPLVGGGVQPRIADCGQCNEQSGRQLSQAWQPMETAPKDGTRILIWFVHAHAKYSDDPIAEGWEAAHEAYWIDHNGGGWTWYGLCGVATLWQPLPNPPSPSSTSATATETDGGDV